MAITDFDHRKLLEVTSAPGSPSFSRAVCLNITSGSGGETGTGEIALDWSNISSAADLAVYDEHNNLLDYYIEHFDASSQQATLWVYRSWVRDGSVQTKVAYGNGPGDQSVSAPTVFDNETNIQAVYLCNEVSGDIIDRTSNGRDGTVYGCSRGLGAIVGRAYGFNGSGDYVGLPASLRDIFKYKDWTVLALYKWRSDNGVLTGTQDGSTYDSFRLYGSGTVRWRDADYEPNQAYAHIDVGDYDVFHAMGDSTTIYGFRNGSLIGTGDISAMSEPINIDSSSELPLGADDDEDALDNFMDMELSCVLIYDAKLSDDDAKTQADAIFNSLFYQRPAEITISSPFSTVGSAAIEPIVIPIIVPTGAGAHIGSPPSWDANQIFIALGRSACLSPSPVPDFYLQTPGELSAYQTGPVTAEIAVPTLTSRVASEGLFPAIPYVNIITAPSAVRSLVVSPDVGYPIWATGSAVVAEAPIRNFVNRAPAGLVPSQGLAWWRWDASPALARTVYTVILIGATSGEEDVVIPANVVSLRRRTGDRGAVVEIETPPDADTAARIADRSSGEIVVYKGAKVGQGYQQTEIIRATLEDVEVLRGRKLRLSGRGQDGGAGRTVEIRPTYRLDEEGSRRYRAAIDPFLRPGDRVMAQGEVLTVEEMSYRIVVGDEQMETEGR